MTFDILDSLLEHHDVKIAVDARECVVRIWRDNGITCRQVADGFFKVKIKRYCIWRAGRNVEAIKAEIL